MANIVQLPSIACRLIWIGPWHQRNQDSNSVTRTPIRKGPKKDQRFQTRNGAWVSCKSFCWTEVHFMGPLVPSVLDFGWLCPWVSKSGWIHRHLRSFVVCLQRFPEQSLVAGTGIEPGLLTCEVSTILLRQLGPALAINLVAVAITKMNNSFFCHLPNYQHFTLHSNDINSLFVPALI